MKELETYLAEDMIIASMVAIHDAKRTPFCATLTSPTRFFERVYIPENLANDFVKAFGEHRKITVEIKAVLPHDHDIPHLEVSRIGA